MPEKNFIKVIAEHQTDGHVRPLKIEYGGEWVEVEHLLAARTAASLKNDGQGILYTCQVLGNQAYLFCDEGQWFLEW